MHLQMCHEFVNCISLFSKQCLCGVVCHEFANIAITAFSHPCLFFLYFRKIKYIQEY